MSAHVYIEPVDNCDNCPLCAESAFCQHPDRRTGEREIWEANGEPYEHAAAWHPPWCPLRRDPILIRLRDGTSP